MSLPQLPPTFEVLTDEERKPTLQWSIFFESLANGDAGTSFTPSFTGLTENGAATKEGVYYRINRKLVYFRITITPGTDTTAVNGTTYCDFPLQFANNGASVSISGYTAAVAGVEASTNRIYTGPWTAITTPITIIGIGEVR
jgi:hypothetical protein